MDPHLRPVRAADVHWRALEEGGVLVRLSDQMRFATDEIGLVLWDRCDGMHSVGDLVSLIVRLFEVSTDRAATDVEHFLGQLDRVELIRLCEGPEATPTPSPDAQPVRSTVLL